MKSSFISKTLFFPKKLILTAILISLTVAPAMVLANAIPEVNNVTASQRTDGSRLVDIYYDLADANGDNCTVWLNVSDDGGASWDVNAVSLTGDIGADITPGTGKYIIWDCGTDLPGEYGTNYQVKVTADDGVTDGPAGMVWVYIDDPGVSGHESFTGYMSKYETTNAQYCQFLNAAKASDDIIVDGSYVKGASGPYSGQNYYNLAGSGYTSFGATNGGAARINWTGSSFTVDSGFENHPVTYVSWYGSTAFASYYGWRLPTEWEWQAVADNTVGDPYTYGCGPTINNSIANYHNSTHPDGTTIVGSFGTYGYGMCDMAGNVWEWTDSIYSGSSLRGGSWYSHRDYICTVSNRSGWAPSFCHFGFGFRACRNSGSAGGQGSAESNIFTIDNREVSLLAPNGGETLTAGSSYPISWSSTGSISDVLIEYSTDNGGNWTGVDPCNIGNTGLYNWLIPQVSSNQCLVRVSDASNPDVNDTSDGVFTINNPPVAVDDANTTDEDTAVTINVLANDTDVDGDPLTVDSVTQPANGLTIVNGDDTVTYTPAVNFNGIDTFNYTISDDKGGTDSATVTITVNAVPDAPVAVDDLYSLDPSGAATVAAPGVLANDTDAEEDPLTTVLVSGPNNGALTLNPNGSFIYTADPCYLGADSFVYEANDGTALSNPATVFLNHPPVADNQLVVTEEDTPVIITLTASDVDDDPLTLTYVVQTSPSHGILTGSEPNLTYTPASNYYGADSFTFKAHDGKFYSNTATVSIDVNSVNDDPDAVNDVAIVDTNSSGNNIYVLANDSDPENDILTITNVTDPNNGAAWIAGNYIEYTPDVNFVGEDSFNYTITDGNGGSDTAVVTVTVRQPPPPPVLVFNQELIEFTVVAGQMHEFTVDINNIDSVSHSLVGLSIVEQVEGLEARFMDPGVTEIIDINAGETFSSALEVDANDAVVGNTYSLWARCLTDGDLQRSDYTELSFLVVQDPNLPDLQVTSEDFNFAPLPGVPNEPATISITVWNVGAISANDVMVVFKDFDTPIGDPCIIPTIGPGESNTVTIHPIWPDASFRLITTTIDPNDQINELDENNNSGSKVYQVGSVPEMEASIIIVCSTPAGFIEGSIATITGQALYEIRVSHQAEYVYMPASSSSVSTQVIHSSGQYDLPGLFTDMEGRFEVSFPVPGQADDEFDVVITISDGFIENVWQKRFDVYEPTAYTDIWIYSEDITFDNNNPSLGETVSIEGLIHASTYNTKKETNIPVTFYERHPILGTSAIGSTQYIEQMPPGTSESVLSDWTNGAEGIYCIEVALEPGFSDNSNGNNQADCPIVIGPLPNAINVVIEAPLENADVNGSDTTSVTVLVTDDYGNIVPPCALDSIDLQFSGVDGRKVGLKNRFNWSSLRYEYSWRPPSDANGQACLDVTAALTADIVGSILTDSNSACVNVVDDAPPNLWIWCSPGSAMTTQVVQITVNSSEPLLDDQLDTITVTDSNGQLIPLDPCGPDNPWSTRWVYRTEPLPASIAKGWATVDVNGTDLRLNEGSGWGSFKVVSGDLWVYSEDISFSNHNPDLGETITIEAIVYSSPSNTETLEQVPMTFYSYHTIVGQWIPIGLTLYIEEIPPASDYLVSTTWRNAAEGAYIMRATLGAEFSDDNSANNEATRALFVGAECDFTDDGEVDRNDLAIFVSRWLWYGQAGSIPEDIINDGVVNFADFQRLAENWMRGVP